MPNSPTGRSVIRRRIGTYTSFRRAMLEGAAAAAGDGGQATAPIFSADPQVSGDYSLMMIELWAYLADILTFYQERVANEAYLPTATQRDSLFRLSHLVNFRPAAGLSASASIAINVDTVVQATIPPDFRIGSKPPPGQPQPIFQTQTALEAFASLNALGVPTTAPGSQFAPLASYAAVYGQTSVSAAERAQAARTVFGDLGPLFLPEFAGPTPPLTTVELLPRRSVVLDGTKHRLAPGDYVLLVENEGTSLERPGVQRLDWVAEDPDAGTTLISWQEAGGYYDESLSPVRLYALRVTAAPFGSTAPAWTGVQQSLHVARNFWEDEVNWDDPDSRWYYLPTPAGSDGVPPADPPNVVYLDREYTTIKATPDIKSWAVLMDSRNGTLDPPLIGIFHVLAAEPASKIAYFMTGRVTRLTLAEDIQGQAYASPPEFPPTSERFALRSTFIYTAPERLPVKQRLPLPEPLAGTSLVFEGAYPELAHGRLVILQGAVAGKPVAEQATVDRVSVDATLGYTTVALRAPLVQRFSRQDTVMLANIVRVDHGESVPREVLGSGNGAAFQSFALKRGPVTYVPTEGADGQVTPKSTLQVTVNDVAWTELDTFVFSKPDELVFSTRQTESGQTVVLFGDGLHGVRPPTGTDNVRATYRVGLGTSGNVPPGAIAQLIDAVPGVQRATNPLEATGGVDADTEAQVRAKAPGAVLTSGRAVTAADFANLALMFGGVGKAAAMWQTGGAADAAGYIKLVVAQSDGSPLDPHSQTAHLLRGFLLSRGSAGVPIRMAGFRPVYVLLEVELRLTDGAPREATLASAEAALSAFFAFDRLQLGQSIYLSAVYQAVQVVPNVLAAHIITLKRADADGARVADIRVDPDELVLITNDSTDLAGNRGKLTVKLGNGR